MTIQLALYSLEEGYEQRFQRWYRDEHVPRVLSQVGWDRMWSYRCTSDRLWATVYELSDKHELGSAAAPFHDVAYAERGLRDYRARKWREIAASGERPGVQNYVNIISVEVLASGVPAFNRWYDEVHVPEILACPGWIANRRYVRLDGHTEFLAVYDLYDDVLPFDTDEWRTAVGWDSQLPAIIGFHGFRVYELEFECVS